MSDANKFEPRTFCGSESLLMVDRLRWESFCLGEHQHGEHWLTRRLWTKVAEVSGQVNLTQEFESLLLRATCDWEHIPADWGMVSLGASPFHCYLLGCSSKYK